MKGERDEALAEVRIQKLRGIRDLRFTLLARATAVFFALANTSASP